MHHAQNAIEPPPTGTIERWAYDYITSERLADKLSPPAPPSEWMQAAPSLCIDRPGRPPELEVVLKGKKTPGPNAIKVPERRAILLHTFLHHELQAAELMCRALLAFPDTPLAFRKGLLGICLDEIRHMAMYGEHMADLGFTYGDFTVNDWFWLRVPNARTPTGFVAVMGLGFEGANLDHTARFAQQFRAAGDGAGARLQDHVSEEEIPHVAFGAHWFKHFAGDLTFERWRQALPAPLSPMVMRGKPLSHGARQRAGYSEAFLKELATWQPT